MQLCASDAVKFVAWKDPGSLQIGKIHGGKMDTFRISGTLHGGRIYFIPVNAKNGFGGYNGFKPIICITSEDGLRIVQINSDAHR